MRRGHSLYLLLAIFPAVLAACDRQVSPAQVNTPGNAPATAPAAVVDVVFFYDDGSSTRLAVPFRDAKAAEAIVRPTLFTAFAEPPPTPHVVRWLIENSRSQASPGPLHFEKGDVQLTVTHSMYGEYRVLPPSADGHWLQCRRGKSDEWTNWAGVPDPETGFQRAMMYLRNDLDHIRSMTDVPLALPGTAPSAEQ